jgi:TolA-binding protein
MDKAPEDSVELYRVMDWFQANRKAVIVVVAIAVVVGVGIGIYFWNQNAQELAANNALSKIKMPANEAGEKAMSADDYLKVATDYPGTRAAARALLIGGGIQFDTGKFEQSQATFEKFLQAYPESQLASEAALGVASSLEAQGKTAEAAARYADVLKRPYAGAVQPQTQSALARCDLALNKPEQALNLYEELARANNNDTWTAEAKIQAHEVLVKYPALGKPKAPLSTASTPTPMPKMSMPVTSTNTAAAPIK